MRAIRFSTYGEPSVLRMEYVPRPESRDGEALVRVASTGFNPIDATIRAGLLQQAHRCSCPTCRGIDVSGTVVALGQDVGEPLVGAEVVAFVPGTAPRAARRVHRGARRTARPGTQGCFTGSTGGSEEQTGPAALEDARLGSGSAAGCGQGTVRSSAVSRRFQVMAAPTA